MCSEAVLWQNFGEAAERLVRSRVGNQEVLQGGMSESCACIPALGAPGVWGQNSTVAPGEHGSKEQAL